MKEVTLKVNTRKYKFFMELIKNFDFVEVSKQESKKETLLSIAKGMLEAKLASEGKIKSRSANEFLNEL